VQVLTNRRMARMAETLDRGKALQPRNIRGLFAMPVIGLGNRWDLGRRDRQG